MISLNILKKYKKTKMYNFVLNWIIPFISLNMMFYIKLIDLKAIYTIVL